MTKALSLYAMHSEWRTRRIDDRDHRCISDEVSRKTMGGSQWFIPNTMKTKATRGESNRLHGCLDFWLSLAMEYFIHYLQVMPTFCSWFTGFIFVVIIRILLKPSKHSILNIVCTCRNNNKTSYNMQHKSF